MNPILNQKEDYYAKSKSSKAGNQSQETGAKEKEVTSPVKRRMLLSSNPEPTGKV